MHRRSRVLVPLGVVAFAAAIWGIVRWRRQAEDATDLWRGAFARRVREAEARGLPTTYEALQRRLEPVAPGRNGADRLPGLAAECHLLFHPYERAGTQAFPQVMWGEDPEPGERAAVVGLLERERARVERLWVLLEELAHTDGIQVPWSRPVGELRPDSPWQGLSWMPRLLWLRVYAHPELHLPTARTALAIAERIAPPAWARDEVMEAGLEMLRRAVERGDAIAEPDVAALRSSVRRLEAGMLDDARLEAMRLRVAWTDRADPGAEGWRWVSDYDRPGGGAQLFRDHIEAFERLDVEVRDLTDEAGLRRVAVRDRRLIPWGGGNDSGLGYDAKKALEAMTRLRLADIALDLLRRDGPPGDPEERVRRVSSWLRAEAPRDALTGEAFEVRAEGRHVLVAVPWRDEEFPLRPAFIRAADDSEEKEAPAAETPTWWDDPLRQDGWIWAMPR